MRRLSLHTNRSATQHLPHLLKTLGTLDGGIPPVGRKLLAMIETWRRGWNCAHATTMFDNTEGCHGFVFTRDAQCEIKLVKCATDSKSPTSFASRNSNIFVPIHSSNSCASLGIASSSQPTPLRLAALVLTASAASTDPLTCAVTGFQLWPSTLPIHLPIRMGLDVQRHLALRRSARATVPVILDPTSGCGAVTLR